MALTADEVTRLRNMIDEPDDTNGWSEVALNLLAEANTSSDGSYDLRKIAGSVWESKAAKLVDAVNISESGSSRSQSQMFDHAIAMAKQFGGSTGETGTSSPSRPRSYRIVRPERA